MGEMLKRYRDLLEKGEYDSIDEMCNDLMLNWDDLYEDDEEDDD